MTLDFDFFQYAFMQRAALAGTACAIAAPILGTFLVVRRLSGMADAFSHLALLGVVLGLVFSTPSVGWVLVLVLASVWVLLRSPLRARAYPEALLVLILSTGLACAVVLLSIAPPAAVSLESLLFGSVVTVSWPSVWLSLGSMVLVGTFVVLLFRRLFLGSLDADLLISSGGQNIWELAFLAVCAVFVYVGLSVMGALLVTAMMIIPVLSALELSLGFRSTLLVSVGLSVLGFWLGLSIAFVFSLAVSPVVALVHAGLFLGMVLFQLLRRMRVPVASRSPHTYE